MSEKSIIIKEEPLEMEARRLASLAMTNPLSLITIEIYKSLKRAYQEGLEDAK